MKDKNRKMNDVRIYREVIDSELERIGSSLSDTRYPALLDGSGSTHAEETNWQLMKYTDLFVFLCETYRHTQFAGVAKACMEGREKISQNGFMLSEFLR